MNVRALKRKQLWLAAAVLVAAGLVATALATAEDEPRPPSRSGTEAGTVGDPQVKQAKWKVQVTVAGKTGELTAGQKRRLKRQRPALVGMVRGVYDAMFLSPETLLSQLRRTFAPKARRAWRSSRAGLPRGAEDVRIGRRQAHIGIDVNKASRATMRTRILARGTRGSREFALDHRSSLYLVRSGKDWRVFAFSVDQGPFKKKGGARSRKDGGKQNTKKRDDGAKRKREKRGGGRS